MYFFCANRSENKIYLTLGVHAGTSNRTSKEGQQSKEDERNAVDKVIDSVSNLFTREKPRDNDKWWKR